MCFALRPTIGAAGRWCFLTLFLNHAVADFVSTVVYTDGYRPTL